MRDSAYQRTLFVEVLVKDSFDAAVNGCFGHINVKFLKGGDPNVVSFELSAQFVKVGEAVFQR
jgi:hypothetical protein